MSRMKLTQAELLAQGGNRLAAVARRALFARGFERKSGMCQRWLRQCVQAEHGARFDEFHGATAEQSRRFWMTSKYAVAPERGSRIGDILYKRGTDAQPAGHVGIRIAGNRVAENSSVHGGDGDARGTRSLEEFGKVDLIVRLPQSQ